MAEKKQYGRKIGNETLKLKHTQPRAFFFRSDEFGKPTEELKAKLRKSRAWYSVAKDKKPNHNNDQHIRDFNITFDETADGLFANTSCNHYSSVKANTIEEVAADAGLSRYVMSNNAAQIDTKEIMESTDTFIKNVATQPQPKQQRKFAKPNQPKKDQPKQQNINPNIENTKDVVDILADYKKSAIQRLAPLPQMSQPTIEEVEQEQPITARNTSGIATNDDNSDSSSGITEIELPPPATQAIQSPKLERSLTKPPLLKQKAKLFLPERVAYPTPEKQRKILVDELEIDREKAKLEEERLRDDENAVMREKQILAELAAKLADRERRKEKITKDKKRNALLKKKLRSKNIEVEDTETDLELEKEANELDVLGNNFNFGDLFTFKNIAIGFGVLVGGNVVFKLLFGSGRQVVAQQPQLIQMPPGFALPQNDSF